MRASDTSELILEEVAVPGANLLGAEGIGKDVTLLIGNLATLFAAVFVSRLIFDFELDVLRTKRIRLTWRKLA